MPRHLTVDDSEFVQDVIGNLLNAGTQDTVFVEYDDVSNVINTSIGHNDIKDIAGEMVSGGTELGISVTYDSGNNRFDFDAQTAGDARYSPIADRRTLTAARTYYVRTDGSDSNTGLANTAGGAFLTIQKAVDTISGLDINGQTVTVQIADGTYTGAVTLKNVVGYAAEGNLVIQGNSGTPANVVISVTSNNCFTASGISSVWTIKDMKLQTTTSGSGLLAQDNSKILFTNLSFGTTVTFHIYAVRGIIQATGNYAISGNAAYHWVASIGGAIKVQSIAAITLSGTPAFTVFALADTTSVLAWNGSAFSGGASAGTKKYDINSNAAAVSGGVTLPGGVAGTTATGGQYL